ncbi:MAG TPA: ARMT1-like domain-containing protein [Phycisphaerae bacterium]|nr:ARMT1-like domain-containing protein [Phycisphaerae bacterium]
MPTFSLLADPHNYIPCSTENMLEDVEYREYWLNHFEHHFDTIVALAHDNYGPAAHERIVACRKDLIETLHQLRRKPDLFGRLDLLVLDTLRQKKLIAHGIPDPFEKMKRRENNTMLPLYPRIVEELDNYADEREALLLAVEGVFAGNIYDLGAGATSKLYAKESPDFLKVRAEVGAKRPWLVDQFNEMADALLGKRLGGKHKQAMFFCDNAGSDTILGVIPFCRLLAKRGTKVLIAANHLPALNDMTAAELKALLPRLQNLDPILNELVRSNLIEVIDSGCEAPLIDLRLVTEEVNAHAATTDLVILEGMGRALESNYEAKFTVDAIKLAMIKEQIVAQRHGGKLFDTVCRFDPA